MPHITYTVHKTREEAVAQKDKMLRSGEIEELDFPRIENVAKEYTLRANTKYPWVVMILES